MLSYMSIMADMNIVLNNNTTDIKTIDKKLQKIDNYDVQKVGKDHNKYIVLLKLLNTILVNIGRDIIDDITNFVNVNRDDIIQDANKISLENMENEIFPLYNKEKCRYYKKNAQGLTLNVLKGMVKEIGYKTNFIKKDIYVTVNGKKYRKTQSLYSIS
jgi:hypothetical protein